jgi:hypothetical protein
VADQVKTAKIKKGKPFTDTDFERISDLVNKTVAKHQKEYFEAEEARKKQEEQQKIKEKEEN